MTGPEAPTDTEAATGGDGAPPVADVATATLDARGIVSAWSAGARALLGYRRSEIVGRPAAPLLAVPAPGSGRATRALRTLDERGRWHGTVTLRRRDGATVDVPLLAHSRRTRDGTDEWFLVSRHERPAAQGPPARRAAPGTDRDRDAPDDELFEQSFVQSPCTEGIYDTQLRLRHASEGVERVLGFAERDIRGLRLSEFAPGPVSDDIERHMRLAVETGEAQELEVPTRMVGHARELIWSLSIAPIRNADGRVRGVIVAAHDRTRQYVARQRLLLVNEASTRIGTTLDVGRTAQQLADVAVPLLADFVTVDLLPAVTDGGEPPPGPLSGDVTLRRVARGSVLEGSPELVVPLGETAVYPASTTPAKALSGGKGLLEAVTDPGTASWEAQDPERAARIRAYGFHSTIAVPLLARGTTLGVATFSRHRRPDPFEQDDLLLAEEITARAAVCVDNARRYTREREIALALQRSLLPATLPEHAAVEAAFRYLPTDTGAGVGGDWFDVIPLSGSRVALVVGDVVGHGVRASATMGRLRTAVRTLADVDLPPDELLTHLDDLVTHLSAEAAGGRGADGSPSAGTGAPADGEPQDEISGDVGATCLYAVYDPVSRRCSVARAGHPVPAVVGPDGGVEFLDVPAGPPLGLGGLPFESVEVELAEGSLLALYTNGLIASRERAPDEMLAALRTALARPAAPLEDICDTVLDSLLPAHPADDVALLLARTRALGSSQVVTWELACDPAIVAEARRDVSAQLAVWGLEDAVFTTELVVSELVTNAIRYAEAPIQLRLIHDGSLICEVSDGSNTAPHLRRARVSDEGGRGLLLVAQLTQSWGTRQGAAGKTIWAEQTLPVEIG
ncbi:SpoIIE family protein phosphatase [Streptomyces corynorhini]|uniref:PAS domain S-box protein n=1 Tax=Streptomyces corynorhini TaxID=2282652 RepID=A0A370BG02_9ACTN|nr:SpoIIE family protein phosphatase [Streptomyces corynorhini]RDG39204.1 PAS domain S-box protein [Streptomyces corynorhini]